MLGIASPEEIGKEKEESLVFHPNLADVTKEPLPAADPDVSAYELEPTGQLKVWSYKSNEAQELGRQESMEKINELIRSCEARQEALNEQLETLRAMREKMWEA